MFVLFGCIGIAVEVFFTAGLDIYAALEAGNPINWDLAGKSYIWMLFIYGLVAFIFPPGYRLLAKWPLPVRLFSYATILFAAEFFTGWLLEATTGHCPWHYTSSLAVMGYIRLDYLPAWMGFGFMLERLHHQFTAWVGAY
jgi:hypothetical protein